jgi:multidrug resistance efflux pump
VRAPASGFVAAVPAHNGAQVSADQVVCVLHNPELELRRVRLLGEVEAEAARLDAVELEDSTQASTHRARLGYLRSGVQELERRLASMRVVAGLDGTVASADWRSWEGRYVREGELLFQIHAGHHYLCMVLTDHEVSRARLEVGSPAEVRWACQPDEPVRAVVREIRRSASRAHVPLALTMLGGGEVYARPDGEAGAVASQPYLQVLLEAESMPLGSRGAGLTARVRMEARVEVLGAWLKRRVLGFVNAWRMS